MEKKVERRDTNTLAYDIVQQVTGQKPKDDAGKNPAAVALGRLGGKKGGKARARKLTPERRAEIARDAAITRWVARHETVHQLRQITERDLLHTISEINNVLALAQRFRYAFDHEDKVVSEYPKYPLETMVEDRGDCEDHAIVAAACLVRLGYDVRLVSLEYGSGPGHMALAVAGADDLPDAFALRDPISGKKFYYCEATTDAGSRDPHVVAFRMGEVPERDRRAKMELILLS